MSDGQKGVVKAAVGNPWGLTAAQLQVVKRISKGATAREIAESLNISPRTIESHTAAAKAKMQAKTLAQAAVLFDRWEFARTFVGVKGGA